MNILKNPNLWAVSIFLFGIVSSSGAATFLALHPESDLELVDLAKLIWLFVPTVFAVLALTISGGWRHVGILPRVRSASAAYPLAIFVPIGVSALLLGTSMVLNPSAFGLAMGLEAGMVAAIVSILLKNLFEEFYWRGVVAPQLLNTKLPPLAAHLLTGVIWSAWHLPYWFVFLSPAEIANASGLSVGSFVVLAFIALTLQSILYGELRLMSGSVWPAYLLHTVSNLVSIVLPVLAYTNTATALNPVFTPDTHGVAYSLGFAALGLWLMRQRLGAPGSE